MRGLAIEFADSAKHSFLVTLLSLSLYYLVTAAYNASFSFAEDLAIFWLGGIPRSLSEVLALQVRRETSCKVLNINTQIDSFSTFDTIFTSSIILVSFILAILWRGTDKVAGTSKDEKPEAACSDDLETGKGVDGDKERLNELESQCQSQLTRIMGLELQLAKAQHDLGEQRIQAAQIAKAHHDLGEQRIQTVQLQKRVEGQRNQIHLLENSLTKAKKNSAQTEATFTTTITQLQNQLKTVNSSCDDLLQEIFDLRVANDQLESRASSLATVKDVSMASSFAVPFVLVLVDGDAYRWSLCHFKSEIASPGAHAAEALKREVQQYILGTQNHIPLQCRIVTRVFYNASGTAPIAERSGPAAKRKLSEFARAFTESGPLFDYLDCGRGKERADSKIQETVHLFINNPSCHSIFFAAASDNSFARLLEQYAYNESAKKKIMLIHHGYVAREIAELGFTAVEWPKVFAHHVDSLTASKTKREASVRELEKNIMAQNATEAIFKGAFGLGKFDFKSLNMTYRVRRDVTMSNASDGKTRDEGVIEDVD